MKKLLYFCILLCIGIAFLNYPVIYTESTNSLPKNELKTIKYTQNEIHIIRSITTLKRGEVGLITIKGIPGEIYTIESSFRVNDKTIPVKQWRRADSNGMASFSWVVGNDTDIGSYKATIYGGESTLSLTHTVIP